MSVDQVLAHLGAEPAAAATDSVRTLIAAELVADPDPAAVAARVRHLVTIADHGPTTAALATVDLILGPGPADAAWGLLHPALVAHVVRLAANRDPSIAHALTGGPAALPALAPGGRLWPSLWTATRSLLAATWSPWAGRRLVAEQLDPLRSAPTVVPVVLTDPDAPDHPPLRLLTASRPDPLRWYLYAGTWEDLPGATPEGR